MAKKQKEIPGSVFKVRINENLQTYGRVLNYGDVAIYECFTKMEIENLNEIVKSNIFFKGYVNDNGIKNGRWQIIGHLPLEIELSNSKYYLPVIGNPDAFRIVENDILKTGFHKQDCAGLFAGVVCAPEHVEGIISDYYNGVENIVLKTYPRMPA